MNRSNSKTIFVKVLYYIVLVAFLFPRGFLETLPVYHTIYVIWTWLAVALIWFQYFCKGIKTTVKVRKEPMLIVLYFILTVILTFLVRGSLSTGLQQMLAYPSLCVFIILNMKRRPEMLMDISINILILTFTLNEILFRGYFVEQYHITFLGHVQMISQIGILAILLSCLYWMLFHKKKIKVTYLTCLTAWIMLNADADSAVLSAVVLIIICIVYKWKLYHLLCFKSSCYILIMLLLSALVVYITSVNNVFGGIIANLNFSGRKYIWQNALLNIGKRPVTGYGIDGILLETFWTQWSGGGFNYAHNQVVQNLLDGGSVLLISFWSMLMAFTSKVSYIKENRYKVLVNSVLLCLLFIMIFDSTTLYCYMYFILSIIYALPHVLQTTDINMFVVNNNYIVTCGRKYNGSYY